MAWRLMACHILPRPGCLCKHFRGVVGEKGAVWGLADDSYGGVLAHKQREIAQVMQWAQLHCWVLVVWSAWLLADCTNRVLGRVIPKCFFFFRINPPVGWRMGMEFGLSVCRSKERRVQMKACRGSYVIC